MASSQKRKNHIAALGDSNGNSLSDHSEKSAILLQASRERLGQTEDVTPLPNLQKILQGDQDLSFLEVPFSHQEIDEVVIPSNKSPRPEGFNAEFLKKCWPIIKQDFCDLCAQFHSGSLCLQSINNCFITLVPKTPGS
jgi:hypothetical protein